MMKYLDVIGLFLLLQSFELFGTVQHGKLRKDWRNIIDDESLMESLNSLKHINLKIATNYDRSDHIDIDESNKAFKILFSVHKPNNNNEQYVTNYNIDTSYDQQCPISDLYELLDIQQEDSDKMNISPKVDISTLTHHHHYNSLRVLRRCYSLLSTIYKKRYMTTGVSGQDLESRSMYYSMINDDDDELNDTLLSTHNSTTLTNIFMTTDRNHGHYISSLSNIEKRLNTYISKTSFKRPYMWMDKVLQERLISNDIFMEERLNDFNNDNDSENDDDIHMNETVVTVKDRSHQFSIVELESLVNSSDIYIYMVPNINSENAQMWEESYNTRVQCHDYNNHNNAILNTSQYSWCIRRSSLKDVNTFSNNSLDINDNLNESISVRNEDKSECILITTYTPMKVQELYDKNNYRKQDDSELTSDKSTMDHIHVHVAESSGPLSIIQYIMTTVKYMYRYLYTPTLLSSMSSLSSRSWGGGGFIIHAAAATLSGDSSWSPSELKKGRRAKELLKIQEYSVDDIDELSVILEEMNQIFYQKLNMIPDTNERIKDSKKEKNNSPNTDNSIKKKNKNKRTSSSSSKSKDIKNMLMKDDGSDILSYVEITTGITRDLDVYLRRYILEGEHDSYQYEILQLVYNYIREMQYIYNVLNQSAKRYLYEDMNMLQTYYTVLNDTYTYGWMHIFEELNTMKNQLMSVESTTSSSSSSSSSSSMRSSHSTGGKKNKQKDKDMGDKSSISSEKTNKNSKKKKSKDKNKDKTLSRTSDHSSYNKDNNQHHQEVDNGDIVRAFTALSMEDRNRFMVLHAFYKAYTNQDGLDEVDFLYEYLYDLFQASTSVDATDTSSSSSSSAAADLNDKSGLYRSESTRTLHDLSMGLDDTDDVTSSLSSMNPNMMIQHVMKALEKQLKKPSILGKSGSKLSSSSSSSRSIDKTVIQLFRKITRKLTPKRWFLSLLSTMDIKTQKAVMDGSSINGKSTSSSSSGKSSQRMKPRSTGGSSSSHSHSQSSSEKKSSKQNSTPSSQSQDTNHRNARSGSDYMRSHPLASYWSLLQETIMTVMHTYRFLDFSPMSSSSSSSSSYRHRGGNTQSGDHHSSSNSYTHGGEWIIDDRDDHYYETNALDVIISLMSCMAILGLVLYVLIKQQQHHKKKKRLISPPKTLSLHLINKHHNNLGNDIAADTTSLSMCRYYMQYITNCVISWYDPTHKNQQESGVIHKIDHANTHASPTITSALNSNSHTSGSLKPSTTGINVSPTKTPIKTSKHKSPHTSHHHHHTLPVTDTVSSLTPTIDISSSSSSSSTQMMPFWEQMIYCWSDAMDIYCDRLKYYCIFFLQYIISSIHTLFQYMYHLIMDTVKMCFIKSFSIGSTSMSSTITHTLNVPVLSPSKSNSTSPQSTPVLKNIQSPITTTGGKDKSHGLHQSDSHHTTATPSMLYPTVTVKNTSISDITNTTPHDESPNKHKKKKKKSTTSVSTTATTGTVEGVSPPFTIENRTSTLLTENDQTKSTCTRQDSVIHDTSVDEDLSHKIHSQNSSETVKVEMTAHKPPNDCAVMSIPNNKMITVTAQSNQRASHDLSMKGRQQSTLHTNPIVTPVKNSMDKTPIHSEIDDQQETEDDGHVDEIIVIGDDDEEEDEEEEDLDDSLFTLISNKKSTHTSEKKKKGKPIVTATPIPMSPIPPIYPYTSHQTEAHMIRKSTHSTVTSSRSNYSITSGNTTHASRSTHHDVTHPTVTSSRTYKGHHPHNAHLNTSNHHHLSESHPISPPITKPVSKLSTISSLLPKALLEASHSTATTINTTNTTTMTNKVISPPHGNITNTSKNMTVSDKSIVTSAHTWAQRLLSNKEKNAQSQDTISPNTSISNSTNTSKKQDTSAKDTTISLHSTNDSDISSLFSHTTYTPSSIPPTSHPTSLHASNSMANNDLHSAYLSSLPTDASYPPSTFLSQLYGKITHSTNSTLFTNMQHGNTGRPSHFSPTELMESVETLSTCTSDQPFTSLTDTTPSSPYLNASHHNTTRTMTQQQQQQCTTLNTATTSGGIMTAGLLPQEYIPSTYLLNDILSTQQACDDNEISGLFEYTTGDMGLLPTTTYEQQLFTPSSLNSLTSPIQHSLYMTQETHSPTIPIGLPTLMSHHTQQSTSQLGPQHSLLPDSVFHQQQGKVSHKPKDPTTMKPKKSSPTVSLTSSAPSIPYNRRASAHASPSAPAVTHGSSTHLLKSPTTMMSSSPYMSTTLNSYSVHDKLVTSPITNHTVTLSPTTNINTSTIIHMKTQVDDYSYINVAQLACHSSDLSAQAPSFSPQYSQYYTSSTMSPILTSQETYPSTCTLLPYEYNTTSFNTSAMGDTTQDMIYTAATAADVIDPEAPPGFESWNGHLVGGTGGSISISEGSHITNMMNINTAFELDPLLNYAMDSNSMLDPYSTIYSTFNAVISPSSNSLPISSLSQPMLTSHTCTSTSLHDVLLDDVEEYMKAYSTTVESTCADTNSTLLSPTYSSLTPSPFMTTTTTQSSARDSMGSSHHSNSH